MVDKPSESPRTVRAMERMTKETQFQLRIAKELLALAVTEAGKDHEAAVKAGQATAASKPSVSKWIRDLITDELRRRGVLR